jgi:hypothetical protein
VPAGAPTEARGLTGEPHRGEELGRQLGGDGRYQIVGPRDRVEGVLGLGELAARFLERLEHHATAEVARIDRLLEVVVDVETELAGLGQRALEVMVAVGGHEELSTVQRRVIHVRCGVGVVRVAAHRHRRLARPGAVRQTLAEEIDEHAAARCARSLLRLDLGRRQHEVVGEGVVDVELERLCDLLPVLGAAEGAGQLDAGAGLDRQRLLEHERRRPPGVVVRDPHQGALALVGEDRPHLERRYVIADPRAHREQVTVLVEGDRRRGGLLRRLLRRDPQVADSRRLRLHDLLHLVLGAAQEEAETGAIADLLRPGGEVRAPVDDLELDLRALAQALPGEIGEEDRLVTA